MDLPTERDPNRLDALALSLWPGLSSASALDKLCQGSPVAFNRLRRAFGVSSKVYRRALRARARRQAREARRIWLDPESKAMRRSCS